MNELLRCIKAVLDKSDEKFIITPSLFDVAKKNKMLPFLSVVMDSKTDPKIQKALFDDYAIALIRNNEQKKALNEIKALFDENKISYLPVKGFALKELYPSEELRYMCDLDIYVGRKYLKQSKNALIRTGYEKIESSEHDVEFAKKPYITIELHHQLIYKKELARKYIDKAIEEMIYIRTNSLEQKIDDINYEYLYIFLHTLSHYELGGIGIRNFVDLHLYLEKHKEELDFVFIHKVYKDTEYEKDALLLERYALNLFDDKYDEMTERILNMGVYGQAYLRRMTELKDCGNSKVRWYFSKMFPKISKMKGLYPCLNNRVMFVFIPIFYIYRILYFLTFGFAKTVKKSREMRSVKVK